MGKYDSKDPLARTTAWRSVDVGSIYWGPSPEGGLRYGKNLFHSNNDNDTLMAVGGFVFGFSTAGFGAAIGGLAGASVSVGLVAGTVRALNRRGVDTEAFEGGVQIGAFTQLIASASAAGSRTSESAVAPDGGPTLLDLSSSASLGRATQVATVPLAAETAELGVAGAAQDVARWVDAEGLFIVNPWLPKDPAREIFNAVAGALPYFW